MNVNNNFNEFVLTLHALQEVTKIEIEAEQEQLSHPPIDYRISIKT